MALLFRALASKPSLIRASGRPVSRLFSSRPNYSDSKTTLKKIALASCMVGGAGYVMQKNSRDDIVQRLGSLVTVAASRKDDEYKTKKTANHPDKLNVKVSGPCKPRKSSEPTCCEYQPHITSPIKSYSLFLWITLEPTADPCSVVNAAIRLDEAIKAAENSCGCSDEICAGVGFGPNFLAQVMGTACKNFCYRHRKGKNGEMPVSDGDIFVHAKCDNLGQLFDFCKHYMHCFPEDCILEFEDIYGFDYKQGRDISGFLDNQTNRCKEEGLREVAIECETGGSYALAQKWVHDFCVVDDDPCKLEQYIGREMATGKELPDKCPTSHVARMTGSTAKNATPKYEIVRQSQNYGSFSDKAGMFFLAYAADPCAFEYMLDQMVGASCDGEHDDVMKMSKNVKGNYWYFPGIKELESLRN